MFSLNRLPSLALEVLLACGLAATAAQAQMVQEVAVGSCQAQGDDHEVLWNGASFLVHSAMPGSANFFCPISAVQAPPQEINSAVVYAANGAAAEEIEVRLCFTDLNVNPGTATSGCGPISTSSNVGWTVEAIKVLPPKGYEIQKSTTAYLRISIPDLGVGEGYSSLRGFVVE